MNTEERVMTVLARANPMPEDDSLELFADGVTYLATLEQRSSEVTQLDTRPTETRRSSTPRLAAVAAAVVIVLGTAMVLLTRNEEPPVATQQTSTTLATPTTTAEGTEELSPQLEEALVVATAFNESRAARNIELMIANSIEGHVNGFVAQSRERMPLEFVWQDAVGWTTEVDGCRITVPDEVSPTIVCEVTHQTAISEALGVGPYPGTYFIKVRYAGGEHAGVAITETIVTEAHTFEFATPQFTNETWRPFIAWLEDRHSDGLDTMLGAEVDGNTDRFLLGGERRPSLSEESIALWAQYTDEFVAEMGQG